MIVGEVRLTAPTKFLWGLLGAPCAEPTNEGRLKMKELKSYSQAVVVAAMILPLASCNMSSDAAFRDAKVQIAQEKAGFSARRDPEALLAKAALNAKSDDDIIRYNRTYANFLIDNGKSGEAYAAFERAALAGDRSSGRRLVKAQTDGVYRPSNLANVARKVYVPLTSDKSEVGARVLLANLVDEGQLSASQFGNSEKWLSEAAEAGGASALRQLAQRAEAKGNLNLALDYYTRADKTTRADRALRQARTNYLGQDGPVNVKRGHAWMEISRKLDRQGAAQLSARIYRQTSGGRDGAYLASVASAGGVSVVSQSQPVSAYKAAKTDEERKKLVEPLKMAAANGNTEAAMVLAQLYIGIGADPSEASDLLVKAYQRGKSDALAPILALLMQAERGQPYAEPLFNVAMKAAANGNVAAARALSSLYSIGGYKPANEDERLKWLQEAADAGDPKSQYEFGLYLYENGKTERSKEMASQYLLKASERGDAFAIAYVKSKNISEN